MKNLRKVFAIVLVLVMLASLFAACSKKDDPEDKPKEYTGTMEENGNTYAEPGWLPIVKTPITVSAIVRDPNIAGNTYSDRTIWKEITEQTNITIDLQVTTNVEPEALVFASRSYPDMAFRIYVDTQVKEAAYAGDIVQLTDEMLQTYAPGWYKLFEENPDIYKLTIQPDGKLYTLPQWVMEESAYELRDMNVINVAWLDELGMDVPTTVNQFTEYLRAVKNNAGKGSIPANASPLYIRMGSAAVNIGSHNSIFDWFGVYQGFNYEIVDNGVVKHNGTNTNIKPAFKYIAQLYTEGLLNEDCLSGDWTKYQTALGNDFDGAKDVISVGSYFGYAINEVYEEAFDPFLPLDASANGATEGPYVRSFGAENRIIKNAFMIFSSSKYPIALLRWADTYGTGEGAMRAVIGEEGEGKQWIKLEDGTYKYDEHAWSHADNSNCYGWNDTALGVVTSDIVQQLIRDDLGEDADHDSRVWAYYNMYKDYLPKDKILYPKNALNFLTTEENLLCDNLQSKVNSVMNTYFKKWVGAKSSVDDDWDAFQEKLVQVGLNDLLALMQKAYDAYSAAK